VSEVWHFTTLCKEKMEKKIKASLEEEFRYGVAASSAMKRLRNRHIFIF